MNPFMGAPKRKKLITIVGIYVGIACSIMVSGGLSTVLPVAARDIGGADIYPLASSISGILGIAVMPLYGYFGSRDPSLKRPLVALSMLVGALVLFVRAIAPTMPVIIIASIFWGLVSAGTFVLSFTMIRDMYEKKQAGILLGAVSTVMSVGMVFGPALTGIIIDVFDWRMVNHILWALMLLSAVLIFSGVKVSREDATAMAVKGGAFDLMGAVALILFLVGTIVSLSLGGSFVPFGSGANTALIIAAGIGFVALVLTVKRKGKEAIIPTPVLKDRNTVCLAAYSLFINFSNMAIFFFMPTYVLYVLQGSATEASLATSIYGVAGLVLGPLLGRAIAKSGNVRTIAASGVVLRTLINIAVIVLVTPVAPVWLIYLLMFVASFYQSQNAVTISTAPQIQIKPELRVMGNSLVSVAQNIGGGVGMAVYTLIMGMFGIAEGMPIALTLAAATSAITLIFVLMLRKLDTADTA
jgi:MFS family permease